MLLRLLDVGLQTRASFPTGGEPRMGHKRIDETMIYVHVAETHRREVPEPVLEAGNAERDPDRRILAMLSARGAFAPQGGRHDREACAHEQDVGCSWRKRGAKRRTSGSILKDRHWLGGGDKGIESKVR